MAQCCLQANNRVHMMKGTHRFITGSQQAIAKTFSILVQIGHANHLTKIAVRNKSLSVAERLELH